MNLKNKKNMKSRQSESALLKKILMTFSRGATRLFRNNVGMFITMDGRTIRTGLCKGSSDLIGWTEVEVTENMVGHKIAVFTAIEVKRKNGRASKEQINFVDSVQRAGGIAQICFSTEDVKNALTSMNKYDML